MPKNTNINVNKEIYELIKEGRINMVFLSPDSKTIKELKENKPAEVTIAPTEGKGAVKRQLVRVDEVQYGYLGNGYPSTYRTRTRMVRLHIDMIVTKPQADETEKTAA